MTAPSYARATVNSIPQQNNVDQQRREVYEALSKPNPEGFPLLAVLMLLEAQVYPNRQSYVYLMTIEYLQNWLTWACHQSLPNDEATRLRKAMPRVIKAMGLSMPSDSHDTYDEPGPIDASPLSVPGHPLLLRPDVAITTAPEELELPIAFRKTLSLNAKPDDSSQDPSLSGKTNGVQKTICCAVPESFYELLRKVHGVVCEDDSTISFQPVEETTGAIHHHIVGARSDLPRPVEFRRRVLFVPALQHNSPLSPVSKLMQHQRQWAPEVEIHPVKLTYSVVGEDMKVGPTKKGFILVSRATLVSDALNALRQAAAPHKARQCARFWYKLSTLRHGSQTIHATQKGDGYDLISWVDSNGATDSKNGNPSTLTVAEWASRINKKSEIRNVEILVETRASIMTTWPRESLELANRIQVGDFVDAQDSAGKWYEAVVRKVTHDSLTVHYAGWASRWDLNIPLRPDKNGGSKNLNPPAPLWSQTARWRENIQVGAAVEIREVGSSVVRPKWYMGTVQKIAGEKDDIRELVGGAEVELYKSDQPGKTNGKKAPLLLLNRRLQVLVEVPQEKLGDTTASQPNGSSSELDARPPYLRWVNLYGEEICNPGTHRKLETAGGPATVNYSFDSSRPPVEIMKSFNNMHGAGFVRESLRGVPPAPGSVGFQNLGNSCFLNSVVQCLNHMEVLTQYFTKGTYIADLNRSNPLGSGGRVATAYASLLTEIWSGQYSILAPRILKQTVASFAPQFNNLYQHDSHEFCSFLMDGIHEDLNRVKKKPYVEELEGFGMEDEKAAIESWRKHLLRHDSIIVDHCQGMHRSHVTCPLCGKESIKFDVYSSISLPVQSEKEDSTIKLSDCLEQFTEGEQLDERNAWYCPGCKKHVCALKMIAVWTVPDILIFHLKRFTFSNKQGKVVRSKIEDIVEFPIDNLDMSEYILGPVDKDVPPVYTLFGVSEHSGSTANSGHYTATVRNSKDDKWYRYNDSHVGITSGEASVTGGAYLLFYQRKKGSLKWAGLEKVMSESDIDPFGGLDKDQDGFTRVKNKKGKKNRKR